MADKSVTFGAAEAFGTLAGWKYTGNDSDVQHQRAVAHDENGDESVSKTYGEMTEISAELEAADVGSISPPSSLGAVLNSDAAVLLGVTINTTATGMATMNLRGHQHGSNPHADAAALRVVSLAAYSLNGFGAKDWFGATLGTDASVESSSLELSCEHVDSDDDDGDHFAGENYNARGTATVTYLGVPTDIVATGWDQLSVNTTRTNTGHLKTVARAEKSLGAMA